MMVRTRNAGRQTLAGMLAAGLLALSAGLAAAQGAPAAGDEAAAAAASAPPSHRPRHRPHRANVEDRLAVLTAELKLDAGQRDAVRKILESQRVQMQKVWSDSSVPSAVRVKSTQAIGDRTADQIRALLTEEQRGRYIKPVPPELRATAASAKVDAYMAGKAVTR